MKEQEVVITESQSDINDYIRKGWRVVSVTAEHVATGAPVKVCGKFCFILEK